MGLAFLWERGHDCVVWDSRFSHSVFLLVKDSEAVQQAAPREVKAKDISAMRLSTLRESYQ